MSEIISIVVPVYNTPVELLKQCVDSLINQTYQDLEIILVDDGSNNGIDKICDDFKSSFSCIKVIHKRNGGLSSARNAGQTVANGKWIMFVDSDDWLEKETCKELMEVCNNYNKLDVVVWGYVHQYKNKVEECKFKYDNETIFDKNDRKKLLEEILSFHLVFSSSCWKLYRSSFLKSNNLLHNENIRQGSEDTEFSIRVLDKIDKLITVNKRYYHYVMNPSSITNKFDEENAYKVVDCFLEIEKYLILKGYNDLLPRFYIRSWYAICASIVSGFMNPNNGLQFNDKKRKLKVYIATDFCKRVMNSINIKDIGVSRRIIFICIKMNWLVVIYLVAVIRKIQKGR